MNPEISFHKYSAEDFHAMSKWLLNASIMKQMDMGPFSKEEIIQWPTDNKVVLMIEKAEGKSIGFVNFYKFNSENRTCYRGTLIDPAFQGKGYGKEAVQKSNSWALTELDVDKVIAYVASDNKRSYANLLSAGMTYDYYDNDKQRHYFYAQR